MQFNIKTDYAMRAVVYLAKTEGIANAEEISKGVDIPYTYVSKVMSGLVRSGLVDSIEGKGGGYCLAKIPQEIDLFSIFACSEPTLSMFHSLDRERHYVGSRRGNSELKKCYCDVQGRLIESLQSKTVDQFL